MSEFLDDLYTQYIPESALIIYKRDSQSSAEIPPYHLELSRVTQHDNQFHLGEQTQLTKSTLDNLSEFLSNREKKRLEPFQFEGAIPNNIHYVSQQGDLPTIVFSLNQPVRKLLFSESLGIKDGEVQLPNLLFVFRAHQLQLFAYKAKKLSPNTKLYAGPFHNTDSSVCMGSARVKWKKRTWNSVMDAIDTAFFRSLFTHYNNVPLKKGYKLEHIFNECIANRTPFPTDALKPVKTTLQNIINYEN